MTGSGARVSPAAPGIRAVIAVAGKVGVDQARVDRMQRFGAEPGARHHDRPVVLDEDVHAFDEPQKQRLGFELLVIEGDPLLVAVDVAEIGFALAAIAAGAHRPPGR